MKLILGFGVSGRAAAAFFYSQGIETVIVDRCVEGCISDRENLSLENIDQVILSPGVSPSHPLVVKAKSLGIEVIGELELAMRHLKNRAFGVTGSNGKTTTVLLVQHILRECGIKASAVGNVGKGISEYLLHLDPEEILIVELSSFQLETLETPKFEACFVLNIYPNHLDRYESFQDYVKAKALIQKTLLNEEELYISNQVKQDFPLYFPKAKVFEKDIAILKQVQYTEIEMPSKQTLSAAYLLCKRCGVTDTEFLDKLKTYKKPEHRIELVDEIAGVAYYNDSKSSNVQSVIHAVEKFSGPVVLIVGGVHKGFSYKSWGPVFSKKVKKVIAYGQAAPMIEKDLKNNFQVEVADQFAEAVSMAKKSAAPGETVLLSPGCSSYDQFKNYQERGDLFKCLVREG